MEAVLREKFILLNAYIRKEEKPKISNLSLHLRELEKEEQIIFKIKRKIIKLRVEINEIENRISIQKINKTKICYLKRPKDIDWLNGYKNKTQINVVYKRPTSDLGTHTD